MKKPLSKLSRLLDYMRSRYWRYLLVAVILFILNEVFLEGRRDVTIVLFLVIVALVFLGAIGMIRRAWLLLHDASELHVGTLVLADTLGAAGIIVLFSIFYLFTDVFKAGALAYGSCGATLADALQHPLVHNLGDIMYFSATTFFTLGFGDICPAGWDKLFAVLNAFAGQLFTTVVIGIGIAFFTESYRMNGKKR